MTFHVSSPLCRALVLVSVAPLATACVLDAIGGHHVHGLATLDGNAPLVIGHRGLPGLYPEETQPSYEGAAKAGAGRRVHGLCEHRVRSAHAVPC